MLFSYYRRPLFLLLAFYAGGILLFPDFFIRRPAPPPFPLPRSGALVEGRISAYPAAGPGGTRFALETEKIYGRPHRTGLMVYARDAGGASYGDRVAFLADLEVPPGAAVPGALDWADYLARRGITAQARARQLEVTARANRFLLLARGVRARALEAFEAAMPPEGAAVLAGVVLGEKRSVPPDLKAAFQDSGAMHLLVASGSNVGFVVAVVYFLCSRFGIKRRYSGLAALALAGFYVTAAGLDAPLVRAYLMFGAGLGAWLLRREAGAFHALTAAGLLILLASPASLFDAGFQMSFLAAYGLTVGTALWGRYLPGGAAGWAPGLLLVSFLAQLGLYPLLAAYFHKVSLVSLLSNMALVPAAGVAMALGFLLAVFAGTALVPALLAPAAKAFMGLFTGTVKFFAALPFASVRVAEPDGWFVGGFFLAAFVLLHAPLLGFRSYKLYAPLLAGALVMAAGRLPAFPAADSALYTGVLFGDSNTSSALIASGAGELYLLNPGVSGKKLADAVLARGTLRVEAVLLSSLEEKNYSGLEELAGLVRVRQVLLPYGPLPADLAALLGRLEQGGAGVRRVWAGENAAENVACGWDGYAPGYAGAGDRVWWEVGGIKLVRGGAGALRSGAGGAEVPAVRGAVVPIGAGQADKLL
ncbi:MAG: ComEC family competence protein [Elusimicrobiales bacterium]|nr:ComEC family competence protein [Elusimicrobiales bacterium]